MAASQASMCLCSSDSNLSNYRRKTIRAAINFPKFRINTVSIPKLPFESDFVDELGLRSDYKDTKTSFIDHRQLRKPINAKEEETCDRLVTEKLYAILEIVADRVEMHKIMGEQRNNWHNLLLTSINGIILAAATMAAITCAASGAPLMALKLSSTLMYVAATGMLIIMNKIQPSQLVEEQRNATRLFKQLQSQVEAIISIGNPTNDDVEEIIKKILALDRAFPLPLLGVMLEKFPSSVEPAVWWPQQEQKRKSNGTMGNNMNGWNDKLEEELRLVVKVLSKKDKADYLRLGKKALKLNKLLAISGPLLTGLAAISSALIGYGSSLTTVIGVMGGALAAIVNMLEHGGQLGMVFEMYRGNAGFFRLMEESIESNLMDRDVGNRSNGEVFEMKVALQLGRSLSELRNFADVSSNGEDLKEFGSKLF